MGQLIARHQLFGVDVMNKVLLAAAALVATPLIAQTMPMPAPSAPHMMMGGEMRDHVQLRTEVAAHVQKMFAMLDTNHDGVLDQTELAAKGGKWGGKGDRDGAAHEGRMPMDRNAMFDKIDSNKDGSISRDEFARHHEGMGAMGEHHGMGGHRGGGMMSRMFGMADANHDGKVTLAEATAMAFQHFDRIDTNHDGKVTPEERQAAHAQMKKMRGN
jgi:Ca2+-binding EF-hand superfamily protein